MSTTTMPQAQEDTEADHETVATESAIAICVDRLSHAYTPARKPRKQRKKSKTPDTLERVALTDISFRVMPGEVFGLLGPNGSGKSTLLRILATVQAMTPPPGSSLGSATILGLDLQQDPAAIRQQIGVVFQSPSLDDKLTAIENLRYHGMLFGITGSALTRRCNELLEIFSLSDRADDPIAQFSGGMRRRIEIAKALLPSPTILLMDEASTGLDVAAQHEMWAVLKEQVNQNGLTILIATHLMDEASRCDRLAMLSQGKLVGVDSLQSLMDSVGGQFLEIEPSESDADAVAMLGQAVEQIVADRKGASVEVLAGKVRVHHDEIVQLAAPLIAELDGQAKRISINQPTLEDAYLRLTGQCLDASTSG